MTPHVLFDMDGVLLDTERFYTEVSQRICARFGKVFDWSVKGNMIGRPAMESARYLVETLGLPLTPEEYLTEREALLDELLPTAKAMPGAVELTRALAAAGAELAVATSSGSRLFDLKTRDHKEWFRIFSALVRGDDPRLERGKPAPDIFLLAAADLGAEPSECVVVEDSPAGVAAGRAAGMRVIAVPDRAMETARFAEADRIVGSLRDLSPADFLL